MFRISKKDDIRAYAYDKSGKLLTSLYDSNFHSIFGVYMGLKCSNDYPYWAEIYEMNIVCDDKCQSVWYRVHKKGFSNITIKKI